MGLWGEALQRRLDRLTGRARPRRHREDAYSGCHLTSETQVKGDGLSFLVSR